MNAALSNSPLAKFGVVVIGRNEGERLEQCLKSLKTASQVVYVDSGSTDGSVQLARNRGAEVVDLDVSRPFTAARARNAGFAHLRKIAPELRYVHFVDGDCEIIDGWPPQALALLERQPEVGAVCGWRRERFPDRSIYNWLCDREWSSGRVGEVDLCGGDVMIRIDTFAQVTGYREDLIAGEDPELCVRLRAAGWRIWRLDVPMTLHDAAMTRFGQWWRRAVRSGYVFAQGAYLHGAPPERHLVWQSQRAWLLGVYLPIACAVIGLVFPPWGFVAWLIYPAYVLEKYVRNPWQERRRGLLALFDVLAQFPYGWGQIKFMRDHLLARQAALIEYK
jgi:glycosyltransferase involved in cell wall biosynthesis